MQLCIFKNLSPYRSFFFSVPRQGHGGRKTFKDASPSRCISNYVKRCVTGGKAAAFSAVGSAENTEVCGLHALCVVQRWCWVMTGFKQDQEGARELTSVCVCVFVRGKHMHLQCVTARFWIYLGQYGGNTCCWCVCVCGCVRGWPAVERFIDSWSMLPTHCVRCADVVQWPQYHFQFLQSGQHLW